MNGSNVLPGRTLECAGSHYGDTQICIAPLLDMPSAWPEEARAALLLIAVLGRGRNTGPKGCGADTDRVLSYSLNESSPGERTD